MNSLLRSLLVVVALVALLITCGAQVLVSELRRPAHADDNIAREFVVEEGDTIATVASRLQRQGLIRQAIWFRLLARSQEPEAPLQVGTYYFSPSMTMRQMLEALHTPRATGEYEEVTVRIGEGTRLEEIADAISAALNFSSEEWLAVARNGSHFKNLTENGEPVYSFLRDLPDEASLEGYLFPDTYNFFKTATITDTVDIMLARFGEMYEQATAEQTIEGRSIHEIVTMASIVQRESGNPEEMGLVASVFWNRLDPNRDFPGRLLGADPTVQYAVGKPGDWWPNLHQNYTVEQLLAIDSPYNTRIYPGLPPGPISAPSFAALKAAAQPAQTDYLFFVAKCGGGGHNFATNAAEHARYEQEFINCPEQEQ